MKFRHILNKEVVQGSFNQSEEVVMAMEAQKVDFEGVVVRRDSDGYGVVKFDKPRIQQQIGFFTQEVINDPTINKWCVKGRKVHGRAIKFGDGYRILRIDAK
jgi:hypothetical protein